MVALLSGCSPGDQRSPHALPVMWRMEAGAERNSRKEVLCCQVFLSSLTPAVLASLFSHRATEEREIRTDLPRWRLPDLGLGRASRTQGGGSKESPIFLLH